MKYIYSLLLTFLLFSSGFAAGEPLPVPNYIKVPPSLNIDKVRVKNLEIDTNIKNILWFVDDKRLEIIQINEKRAILQCLTDATIYINFFYAEGDVVKGPIRLKVVVGSGDPDNPGPLPPVPPGPGPITDFEKAVATAYNSDVITKDKLTQRNTLIAFYKAAISNVIKDKQLDTVGKLVGVLSLTAREAMGDNLNTTRLEIQKYLDTRLPKTTDTKITDELRSSYEEEFKKVIVALEKI